MADVLRREDVEQLESHRDAAEPAEFRVHVAAARMRSHVVRFAAPFIAVLAACDGGGSAPAPAVRAVSLTTAHLQLAAPSEFLLASLFQPRVAADPGANTDIRWSISDTVNARIEADGMLRLCAAIPDLTVTATSVADSTKRAVAHATVTEIAVSWASLTSVLDATSGAPADMRALRGEVLVGIVVDDRWLRCSSAPARLELWVSPAVGTPVLVAARSFAPGATTDAAHSFRWNSASLPNGSYSFVTRVYIAGRAEPARSMTSAPFDVRN